MKSPREILLARHRHEESSLDAIRLEALKQAGSAERELVPAATPWPSPTELFFRLRWHLAALAAVWAAIATLSILAASSRSPTPQLNRPIASQGMTVARENRRLLNELLRPGSVAEPPAAIPGAALPRGDAYFRFVNV